MPRILIASCMQEVSSFNPLPSHYDDFRIEHPSQLNSHASFTTGGRACQKPAGRLQGWDTIRIIRLM